MKKRVPPDAFDYYFALGVDRSHRAVAARYEVSKQTITKIAKRDRWRERLTEIEEKARKSLAQKSVESMEQVTQRHLQTLKVIQTKALQALKSMPLTGAMDAVRALDLSIAKERLIRGEPSDRTAVTVEETIRREYDRWLVTAGEGVDDGSSQ